MTLFWEFHITKKWVSVEKICCGRGRQPVTPEGMQTLETHCDKDRRAGFYILPFLSQEHSCWSCHSELRTFCPYFVFENFAVYAFIKELIHKILSKKFTNIGLILIICLLSNILGIRHPWSSLKQISLSPKWYKLLFLRKIRYSITSTSYLSLEHLILLTACMP